MEQSRGGRAFPSPDLAVKVVTSNGGKAINSLGVHTSPAITAVSPDSSVSQSHVTCKKGDFSNWEKSQTQNCICFKELTSFVICHFTVFCNMDTGSVLGLCS